MTMEVVNDLTETNNPRPNQQLFALSVGNFVSGLLGTMGGGATVRAAGASHSVPLTTTSLCHCKPAKLNPHASFCTRLACQ